MARAILLALLLAGCGSWEPPEETGAPPRPMPAGMAIRVISVPDKDLQALKSKTEYASRGGRLGGYTVVGLGILQCVIRITDRPMPAEEYERIAAHERRHCTGQQHVLQTI